MGWLSLPGIHCRLNLRKGNWKLRNQKYSQWAGREEFFERERHKEPVAGWHSCAIACAGLETII